MTTNEHITANLIRYLDASTPEYAFLITGEWGAGKTYFIDKFIESYVNTDKALIKISLFGLTSTKEINEKIFEYSHPILGSKKVRLASKLVKGALSFGLRLDLDADGKPDSTINAKPDKIEISDLFDPLARNSEKVLILDDLERSKIPLIDTLGYINELTEILNTKVVVLINENQISESEKSTYSRFKEKVVGKTYEVTQDESSIIDEFTLNASEEIKKVRNEIIDIYRLSGYKNLRKLKQSISDFEDLTGELKSEYLENYEFYKNLTRTFFSLSIEIKAGTITAADLECNKPFQKLSASDINRRDVFSIYFKNTPHLYEGKIWVTLIFKGAVKNINEATSKLAFFIDKSEEHPLQAWRALMSFKNLEDDEFYRCIKELCEELEGAVECDIRVYAQKLSIAFYFSSHGLFPLDHKEIRRLAEVYIDEFKGSENWRDQKFTGSVFSDGLGYNYLSSGDEGFLELLEIMKVESEKSFTLGESAREAIAKEKSINNFRSSDTETFIKLLINQYETTPILNDRLSSHFVERLISSKNMDVEKIYNVVIQRYRDSLTVNGYTLPQILKSEREFWVRTLREMEVSIGAVTGIKKHILSLFAKDIEDRILVRFQS